MKLEQHFDVWQQFNKKVYQHTLNQDNILKNGNEVYVESVIRIDEKENNKYALDEKHLINTKCLLLEKNGQKYILPAHFQTLMPLNVKSSFDCFLKKSDTTVYKFITEPTSVSIKGEKLMSLKQFITEFNPMKSNNDRVWTFLKIQSLGSCANGGKYRLCSNPESGKNSNDTIYRYITNRVVKISKPSLAKLETLFFFNQKVIPDEITSLKSEQVREVEPFFLSIADETPEFEKHSLAKRKDMNSVDISSASCVFTYNKPENLNKDALFFDDIWQNIGALNSRYPALLLPDSSILDDVPKLSDQESRKLLDNNFDMLRKLAKTAMYYMQNMSKEIRGWDRSRLVIKSTRHKTNTQCIIDALDAYSDTQKEFDEWIDFVNGCVIGYAEMTIKRKGTEEVFVSPVEEFVK